MDKPEKVVQLIAFIRDFHPRVATMLHWNWGMPEFESILDELLMYDEGKNRQGFDTGVFAAILEIQKIYNELKGESKPDPWSHVKP